MPTKIEAGVKNRLDEFFSKVLELHGPNATLRGIREVAAEYGISVSNDAADTFKKGPFARHLERLRSGNEMRKALTDAVGAGEHPLNAIEDAMVLELEDHLTAADDGKIDVKFVIGQVSKLRLSLSLREESRRKQTDLERKVADSEAGRANDSRRIAVLERQLELAQLDAATAVLTQAEELRTIVQDNTLDQAAKVQRVREKLFGQAPLDFQPVGEKGAKE